MSTQLDEVFSAVADPTRRSIVQRLRSGRLSVSEIARPLPMSLPAVSRHLTVLEDAGVLRRVKAGRVRYCELVPQPLAEAEAWLTGFRTFFETRLDRLVEQLSTGKEPS